MEIDSAVAVDTSCVLGEVCYKCKEAIVILQNNHVAAVASRTLFLLIWCVGKL